MQRADESGIVRTITTVAVHTWSPRWHAASWALASLLLTLGATVAASVVLLLSDDLGPQLRGALLTGVLTFLPYGLVGSFLISRQPDLPFGWLLSGASAGLVLGLATAGPALAAVQDGGTGLLPRWGLLTSGLAFLPIGVQGLINVRFPSGKPATRKGRVLEALLVAGLCFAVLGGVLGSGTFREAASGTGPQSANPLTGGTPVEAVVDALTFTAPVVVLLGLVAGLGVVVRFRRAVGIERQQLKWRATGVVGALALFPLAVTERLGPAVDALDAWLFVATIVVPVVRYRLWTIDTIIRRSVVYGAVTVVLIAG